MTDLKEMSYHELVDHYAGVVLTQLLAGKLREGVVAAMAGATQWHTAQQEQMTPDDMRRQLKATCRDMGLTPTAFAKHAGFDGSTITKFLSGKTGMTTKTFEHLRQAAQRRPR